MFLLATLATGLGWLWWTYDFLGLSGDERAAYDDGVTAFTNKPWFPWGQAPRASDIIVVAIDDKTFIDVKTFEPWRMRYGAWPYDRVIYADVIEYLKEAGAKLVVFDATLDEPKADPTGDLAMSQTVLETGLPLYLGFNVIPKSDALPAVTAVNHPPLAARPPSAAPEAGPSGEVAAASEDEEESFEEAPAPAEEDAAAKAKRLERVASRYAFPVETRGGLTLENLEGAPTHDELGNVVGSLEQHPVPAIEPMLDAVSGWGLVLLEEDEDGKMRRTRFAYTDGANTYVTLPVAAAADALGAERLVLEPGWLTLGDRRIPIDSDGSAWIDFGGTTASRYRSISLVDVLRARERPELAKLFKDKYVFIGGFALGTADVKATPIEQRAVGVTKQLAVFEGLMHRGFITTAPTWVSLVFTFLVCLFSVALVLVVRNVFVDIGWPVLLYTGFFVLTGLFLAVTKVHLLTALPSLAGTLASVMATVYERLFSDQERERLKEQFSAYMERDLVDKMVESQELPRLDGETLVITAFFSDIKGFSSVSERYREDPKGLMRLLNRYLSTVTPALTQHGACIDKYIGDAVVALFGAPVKHVDHPLRACRAALAVQGALETLRAELEKEGLPEISTRIGLNTDAMLVGNIGSEQLLDYTAIGDGMNLAARLEGANKEFGTRIIMGEKTYLAVREHVVARELGLVRVAGKREVSRVYELVGLAGAVAPATLELHRRYAQALAAYTSRSFELAVTILADVLTAHPGDEPSRVLLERCQQRLKKAPPPEWDGVVDLEK